MSESFSGTMRLGLIGAVACLCSACGSTPSDGAAMTPEQMQAKPTAALCDAVAQATSDKEAMLQEMLGRHAIKDEHVAAIRDGKVVTGMNSCETIAAWGPPTTFSSTPGIDYRSVPSVVGAAMVYDYGARGKIGFGANGLVSTVVR